MPQLDLMLEKRRQAPELQHRSYPVLQLEGHQVGFWGSLLLPNLWKVEGGAAHSQQQQHQHAL